MRNVQIFQLSRLAAIKRLIILVVLTGSVGSSAYGIVSHAQSDDRGGIITGRVRDATNGRGIAGAMVQIDGRTLITDPQGGIARTLIPFDGPIKPVDVEIRAPGYAPWRYEELELSSAHAVTIDAELGSTPVVFAPLQPITSAATPFDGPPEYINVGRTFSTDCVSPPNVQRIDRMRFVDYVRNVLPNEWIRTWPAASLDAGAVAVSQYAWKVAFVDRKWARRGYTFDILDSVCDQVYKDRDPTRNYAATDAAVARMWGIALLRDGQLITTYYRDRDESCVRSNSPDCMGQWGSYDRALEGMTGLQILHYYYDPVVDVQTVGSPGAELISRSPDVTLWPGKTQTLSVCLRNAGTQTWQRGITNLMTLDPSDPENTAYVSPFATDTWINPSRPTTLEQTSIATGDNGTWRFAVTAPSDLPPGTYRIAVQPLQEGSDPIPTDVPIEWTITVTNPPPTLSLPPRVWLPLVFGPSNTLVGACS